MWVCHRIRHFFDLFLVYQPFFLCFFFLFRTFSIVSYLYYYHNRQNLAKLFRMTCLDREVNFLESSSACLLLVFLVFMVVLRHTNKCLIDVVCDMYEYSERSVKLLCDSVFCSMKAIDVKGRRGENGNATIPSAVFVGVIRVFSERFGS